MRISTQNQKSHRNNGVEMVNLWIQNSAERFNRKLDEGEGESVN